MEGTVARGAGTVPSGVAATVEFQHVSKSYQRRAGASAVEDLSLEVPAGRICVLVGPSGCGKTTSLKMVNRLIEPSGGKILIDGVDVATRDVTELRRGIGYVIQQVGLFPHKTVSENVAVVPRLLGWPAARRAARSDELLSLVGLDPSVYGLRYPVQLSGGERQRVGVARALAADPPLMLMDEPFAAVDPIVRGNLQDEFLRLQRELAKTILFVTHDIDEAIKMGDLVAVMQQGGHLAQYASPEELLARPASDFVARFVGADRGLKRLALSRIENLELEPVLTALMGEEAAGVRRRAADAPFPYVLLVDFGGLPVGWIAADELPAQGPVDAGRVTPLSPLLEPNTTLKEAAARMIDADVQVGIVVDRTGRPTGLATLESIGQHLRRVNREAEARAGATARDTAAAATRA